MKMIRKVFAVLIAITFVSMALTVHAQPKVPKANIPPDIPADVKQQIEELYSLDPAVRTQAAFGLGEMGEKAAPAIPFLTGMLHDTATPVFWLPPLGGIHTLPCYEAAKALGKIGGVGIDSLISALKDENRNIRYHAAIGLSQSKDPRRVEPLIDALKDPYEHIRRYAAFGLIGINDPRLIEPLIPLLKDKNVNVRFHIAHALSKLKDPRIVEPFIEALKDTDSRVRVYAASGLSKLKDKRLVQPMLDALKDSHAKVRASAAWTLGMIGDARAVEPLIVLLKDESWQVEEIAAYALGQIKDTRAVEPLINTLKTGGHGYVLTRAAQALQNITGQKFGTNHAQWQKWWKENK